MRFASPLVLLFLSSFVWSGWVVPARAGEVEPELEHILGTNTTAPALVVLESVAPATHGSGGGTLAFLRRWAVSTQAPVRKRLSRLGVSSPAVQPFWLINALALSVSREMAQEIARWPEVREVRLDRTLQLPALPPSHTTAGAPAAGYSKNLLMLGVDRVHGEYGITGRGVRVGHTDIGVDASHPALLGKVIAFKDFAEGQANPYDPHGHGTHTAGTIAARQSLGRSVGVAPGALLVSAKAFNKSAQSQDSWLLSAFQWLADPDGNPATDDGARISSNSWGNTESADKTFWEATKKLTELGILVVAASGNDGNSHRPHSPGGYPHVFCVGAVDNERRLASFSNTGPMVWDGASVIKPDVVAPGIDVLSCQPGGAYGHNSGTSMATPHVAAVAALLLEADPTLSVERLVAVLHENTADLGDPGPDNGFGYGLIDAYAAVASVFKGGRVSGTVSREDTGAPLDARIRDEGEDREVPAAGGSFSLWFKPGHHQLVASAFGFVDRSIDVEVGQGTALSVAVALSVSPTGVLTGRVLSPPDASLVAATASLIDTPVTAAAPAGTYRIEAPAGTYTLLVEAPGFRPSRQTVTIQPGQTQTLDVTLETLPPVLIVKADGGHDYEKYIATALEDIGLGHDLLDQVATPVATTAALAPYQLVIWETGKQMFRTFPVQAQAAIRSYLAGGGALLATGQNIGFDLSVTGKPFYSSVLGARYIANNAAATRVAATTGYPGPPGATFSLSGGDGAGNQTSPDVIEAAGAGSVAILSYVKTPSQDPVRREAGPAPGAAVHTKVGSGRVVYLAFGLEGIATRAERARLVKALSGALKPSVTAEVRRLEQLARERRASGVGQVAPGPRGAGAFAASSARLLDRILRALETGHREELEEYFDSLPATSLTPLTRVLERARSHTMILEGGR